METTIKFKPNFLYDANLSKGCGFRLTWRNNGKQAVAAFKSVKSSAAGQEKFLLEDHEYFLGEDEVLGWSNPAEMIKILDDGDICTEGIRRLLARHEIKI